MGKPSRLPRPCRGPPGRGCDRAGRAAPGLVDPAGGDQLGGSGNWRRRWPSIIDRLDHLQAESPPRRRTGPETSTVPPRSWPKKKLRPSTSPRACEPAAGRSGRRTPAAPCCRKASVGRDRPPRRRRPTRPAARPSARSSTAGPGPPRGAAGGPGADRRSRPPPAPPAAGHRQQPLDDPRMPPVDAVEIADRHARRRGTAAGRSSRASGRDPHVHRLTRRDRGGPAP